MGAPIPFGLDFITFPWESIFFLDNAGYVSASEIIFLDDSVLIELLHLGLDGRSPQLNYLWLAYFTSLLWFIWQTNLE